MLMTYRKVMVMCWKWEMFKARFFYSVKRLYFHWCSALNNLSYFGSRPFAIADCLFSPLYLSRQMSLALIQDARICASFVVTFKCHFWRNRALAGCLAKEVMTTVARDSGRAG